MKQLHILLCMVFLLNGYCFAQKPFVPNSEQKLARPYLFAGLPDQFECSYISLQQLLSAKVNEQINSQLSGQFFIKGKIVEKNQQEGGTFSVNIRLENYHNALFNLTIQLMPDHSVRIQGRIFRPGYTDALILYKQKEKYFFKKQSVSLLMPD